MSRAVKPGLLRHLLSPPALFLAFTGWSLILTYPLLLHPLTMIPRGSEETGTVPLFNLWTLQWNISQLLQGYPDYWNAPIFAPFTGTFAFSEPQPLSALLAAPVWLAFQAPAFGYNLLIILFLTLNGWFAYWLLRQWRVARLPAFLAGLMVASLPFVAQEMGVLQLVAVFGFLWSLLFLSRFLNYSERQEIHWPTTLALALGTPVTFFTCGYYGLFSLLFLPLFFVSQLCPGHLNRVMLRQLPGAALLVLIMTAPFLWAQQQHLAQYGFIRRPQIIENNSAKPIYYTYTLDQNLWYVRLLGRESGQGQRLFPGLALILLAGLGLAGSGQSRLKLYLLLATGLAFFLSLGLRLHLGEIQPYQWIRDYIPGFAQLRSPFRFALLVQLHLGLLAGLGLQNLARWLPKQGRYLLLAGAAAIVLIESLALPLPLQSTPSNHPALAWQAWLNQRAEPPQVVLLPFAPSSRVTDFEQTAHWMLENGKLRGRMVNGYSGFFPQDHAELREQMLKFPTPEGLALLREKQVDYVIVHQRLTGAPSQAVLQAHLPLVYWDEANGVAIYEVSK